MSSEKGYDDLIYPILCGEGNIVDFFDRIFDFLYRRTDFFKLKIDDADNLGLNAGEAEKIVRSMFCKYMELAISEQKNSSNSEIEHLFPDYVAEETVVTSPEQDETQYNEETTNSNRDENLSNGDNKKDDESDTKIPLMDHDSYNGANYEGYSWAQTLKDTDIRIKVPDTITAGKQVRVKIQHTHIKVETLVDGKWDVLKEKDLVRKINVEESTWTLVPREHIHICLQKLQERWWDSCFVEEPRIDLKSIDPSIAYEELDEESQAKINELMYNQHLKRLGKPTIQQSEVHNILKEAWHSEGSPFKDQPYDPTLIDVQSSGDVKL